MLWSFDDRMAGTCEHTTRLLREHLRLAGLPDDSQAWPWVLARSPLGGRGVIATRDIAAVELVFYDVPLLLGPRAGRSDELLRAVIPVRCLSLSPLKRQVLQCLQSHCSPEHSFEVWQSDTTGCPFYRVTHSKP